MLVRHAARIMPPSLAEVEEEVGGSTCQSRVWRRWGGEGREIVVRRESGGDGGRGNVVRRESGGGGGGGRGIRIMGR